MERVSAYFSTLFNTKFTISVRAEGPTRHQRRNFTQQQSLSRFLLTTDKDFTCLLYSWLTL
jgi:hypothetical protein